MSEVLFRFENMEIWQRAADLSGPLFKLADLLDQGRYYQFAKQLRAAGLSITNNIAEGSGSVHDKEFKQFLNTARRSVFEDASMLLVFESLSLLERLDVDDLLNRCDELSRKITNFSRSIGS